MYRFKYITILLISLSGSVVTAQNATEIDASIFGVVRVFEDSTHQFFSPPGSIDNDPWALPGTMITLMDMDSIVVTGTSANQNTAEFELNGLKPAQYIIKTSYIGYEDFESVISLKKGQRLSLDITISQIYPAEELPFGVNEALMDIQEGIVEFLDPYFTIGCDYETDEITEEIKLMKLELQNRYGFSERSITDEYTVHNWEKVRQASIRYNQIVEKHLEEINGKNWRKEYEAELNLGTKRILSEH